MSIEDNTEKEADAKKPADSSNSLAAGQPVNGASSSRNVIFQKFRSRKFFNRRTWIWLKRGILPLLGLLVALGIILGIFLFYRYNPDIFEQMETYGYLGVFLISILFNATIIFPLSNLSIIISMGATLPVPFFVGLTGGSGAAIGELTGYLAGRSGQGMFRKSKIYLQLEKGEEARYLGIVNMATAGGAALARVIGPVIDYFNNRSANLGYDFMLLMCMVYFAAGSLLILKIKRKT